MKIIKTYESFNLDELDLGRFSEVIDKTKLTLNEDGTYDYDGYLYFNNLNLNSLLEIPIRFNRINGFYNCNYNDLLSLEGAPLYVGGNFTCNMNKLISLQYAPLEVNGNFDCYGNSLLSTKYFTKVKRKFFAGRSIFDTTYGLEQITEIIKMMTHEQQMKELDFFKSIERKAYKMMKEVLDSLGVNYGQETRSMVGVMNKDFTNAKEMF